MKKILYAALFVGMVTMAAVSSGCSKREQVLASTSVISAVGAGASFLSGHELRNKCRKRRMRELRDASLFNAGRDSYKQSIANK